MHTDRPVSRMRRQPTRRSLVARPLRLVVRGLVALPLAVAAAPMALLGGAATAARAHRAVLRRLGPPGRPPDDGPAPGAARVLGHSLLALVPALLSCAAAVLALFVCWSGYLYGLRPDTVGTLGHPFTSDPLLADAWGGPTLAGAWAVHALVASTIQLVCLVVLHGTLTVQDRATRRLLRL